MIVYNFTQFAKLYYFLTVRVLSYQNESSWTSKIVLNNESFYTLLVLSDVINCLRLPSTLAMRNILLNCIAIGLNIGGFQ